MRNKITTAAEAVALIADGDTITTSGFVGIGVPEALLVALEARFVESGNPRDLTLLFAAGQGDGRDRGLNHLGHEGLLASVIGGHWGLIPKVSQLAMDGLIDAWNLPQGVISQLYRDIAAAKPGHLSRVGLGTFVDPRLEGGRINERTTGDIVSVMSVDGEEYLFYRSRPIQVALLRGTTADPAGNVSMEKEALTIDNLAQAMAAKNSGGIVIVQVERIVAPGTINPREVVIPGVLVDAVVVAEPHHHMQTFATAYNHAFTGRYRAEEGGAADVLPLSARKVIARRAAFELPVNGVVNLGIGMPEGVAAVASEEKLLHHVTLTAEPGVVGGQPASGLDFGAAVNTDAIVDQNQQFDFYDGGGLDLAVLGMAEVDRTGSVNVSRFGSRLAGAGGFINISQRAHSVVFAGTFTSSGADLAIEDGHLRIVQEGRITKFTEWVRQITFSGPRAAREGRSVLFVTERAVFELIPKGLQLIEIAPGVDLQRDVLALMDFQPLVEDVEEMDRRLFLPEAMELRTDLLHLDLPDRIALGSDGRLFINFENLRVRSTDDLDQIRERVEAVCGPLGRRVDVVVNYDRTRIDEEIEDAYIGTVRALEDRYYGTVSRYSGSAFMRMKLGEAFSREAPAPVFETAAQARAFLEGKGRP